MTSPTSDTPLIERLRAATAGEYTVVRELGRGGYAAVFLARDLELERDVAIKVLTIAARQDDPGTTGEVERFRREARTAGRLSHPNIIPIYAVKANEGLQYFVMKYVRGRPLDGVVQSAGALPLALVQTILSQAGSALAYAHKNGVVHRDVKPANIMLDEDGWAVVADFGIAQVARADKLTATGMIIGTAAYMSPEQWAGQQVSGLSDEYSLGIVAYELLTGKPPFTGETAPALLWSHLNEQPAPIADVRPDCPDALSRIVMRMLEKEPKARWPTLDEAVAAIAALPLPQSKEETRTQLISLATTGMNSGDLLGAVDASGAPVMPSNRVARLLLSPSSAEVTVSASMRVQVSALNDTGKQLARRVVSWRSGDVAVATVDADGVVSARGPGSTTIYAVCEGVEISMPVVVTGERVVALPRSNRRTMIGGGVIAAAIAVAVAFKIFSSTAAPPSGGTKPNDTLTKQLPAVRPDSPLKAPPPSGKPNVAQEKQQTKQPDVRGGRGAVTPLDTGKKSDPAPPAVTPAGGAGAAASGAANGPVLPKPDSNAGRIGAVDSKSSAQPERGGAAPPTTSAPAGDPAPTGPMFAELSAGGGSTCASMTNNADVLCWGADGTGGKEISGFYFTQLAVGGGHTCGLTPDGVAYCWGLNDQGQLGDNSTITRATPTKVVTRVAFKSISVGASHSCALAQDGTGWCWGSNKNGQLGDGSLTTRKTPVQVQGKDTFQSLSAGGGFTCGVRGTTPFCWGSGFAGQLGNAMQQDQRDPQPVASKLKFTNVVTGGDHACALSSGHAYCWGANEKGQLGNDTKDSRNKPDSVTTDLVFRQLSAGFNHTCGLTNGGAIYCWGENISGQLGDGTKSIRMVPVVVVAKDVSWKKVSAGNAHTCGISRTDLVYCWGANTQGQIGTGASGGPQLLPAPIKIGPRKQ